MDHLAVLLRDQDREFSFMTDMNPGSLNVVCATFSGYPHGYCINHMKANLQGKFAISSNVEKKDRAMKLFLKCAYAASKYVFHYNLNKLMSLDKRKVSSF